MSINVGINRYFMVLLLALIGLALALASLGFFRCPQAYGADRLIVKDGSSNTVFKVEDNGNLRSYGSVFPVLKVARTVSQTTSGRGVAAFELISTGDMQDTFGPSFEFWISDAAYTATKSVVAMEGVRDGNDTSGKWILRTANSGTLAANLVVDKSGNLGIKRESPSYPVHLGNGAYCSAGGVWTNASSREYKQDIKALTKDLAFKTLEGLEPVSFRYKTEDDESHLGFIAEDVPEIVATKDRKGMSSMDVVAVLTKVVKEQQKMMEEQQKTISDLSQKISVLESKLTAK
jgi:hypothetical protein